MNEPRHAKTAVVHVQLQNMDQGSLDLCSAFARNAVVETCPTSLSLMWPSIVFNGRMIFGRLKQLASIAGKWSEYQNRYFELSTIMDFFLGESCQTCAQNVRSFGVEQTGWRDLSTGRRLLSLDQSAIDG